MTVFVEEKDFNEVTREGFWIADFLTDHCAPCKILGMTLAEIIYDNPEINIARCDIEKSPAYAERFQITGTPTLLFMLDGVVKARLYGAQSREALESVISETMYG